MIWEQTITLTSPLRSVRLGGGGGGEQGSKPPEQTTETTRAALLSTSVAAARVPTSAADEQSATNELLAQLVELLQQRRESSGAACRDLQVAAIEIALAVVERLYLSRVTQGDQDLVRLVNDAIELLQPAGPVAVHLHPEDARQLETAMEGISDDDLQLVADQQIQRGNCQIGSGELAARFDWATQLTELRQRLLQGLTDANSGT